jgi:ribonuclease HII
VKALECGFERALWKEGLSAVAGIDEAGRGPLAGPVVAAAVVFPPEVWIQGVDDSKALGASRREELYDIILGCATDVGIGIVSHDEIDEINIYRATMKAMTGAVSALRRQPGHLLVDGPRFHHPVIPATAVVGGDARCFSIAAASIVAKVTRDRIMVDFAGSYPAYGFERHKGYGTPAHLRAIREFGPCRIHRKSFRMPPRESGGG